jgi:hypothetical protein
MAKVNLLLQAVWTSTRAVIAQPPNLERANSTSGERERERESESHARGPHDLWAQNPLHPPPDIEVAPLPDFELPILADLAREKRGRKFPVIPG